MTRLVARLLLAVLLLPMTGVVFVIAFAMLIRGGPPQGRTLSLLWAVVYLFVGMYWLLLWYAEVRWTPRRIVLTLAATLLSVVAGGLIGMLCMMFNRGLPFQVGMLVGGGIPPIAWVLATILVWRETAAERLERLSALGAAVTCPGCGYNLTGLRELRCPECGRTFSIDQLLAAQPGRENLQGERELGRVQ